MGDGLRLWNELRNFGRVFFVLEFFLYLGLIVFECYLCLFIYYLLSVDDMIVIMWGISSRDLCLGLKIFRYFFLKRRFNWVRYYINYDVSVWIDLWGFLSLFSLGGVEWRFLFRRFGIIYFKWVLFYYVIILGGYTFVVIILLLFNMFGIIFWEFEIEGFRI